MKRRAVWLGAACLLLGGVFYGYFWEPRPWISEPEVPQGPRLDQSEALVHGLTPKLQALGLGLREGRLGSEDCAELFGESLVVLDVSFEPESTRRLEGLGVQVSQWSVEKARNFDRAHERVWSGPLQAVAEFEYLEFHVADAHFDAADPMRWSVQLELEGRARGQEGEAIGFRGLVNTGWWVGEGQFQMREWAMVELETLELSMPLFVDVLDELVTPDVLARARRSIHEEKVLAAIESGGKTKGRLEYESFDRHPGISVVDIDSDGWDDLYVMARHGTNLLLRNRGDGSLEEVSEAWGLDVDSHCSAAVFGDFDNDGDPDLFLGRTLEPSMFLENTGSEFVDVSAEKFEGRLPSLVSSVNAVDYDQDGLLDVYVSTYAASMVEQAREWLERESWSGRPVLEGFLGEEEAADLGLRLFDEDFHFYLQRPGPRNVLLHNDGGGAFSEEGRSAVLSVGRNTYQAAWGDYDGDGDPDVYLSNDFAPNQLFRNDRGGSFSDVTSATGSADYGFGMGVSWGDYDNDDRLDLYVSNMYSRAGNRVVKGAGEVDSRVVKAAAGNSLLRNEGERFKRVSGLKTPALEVARAGWSWGGQFSDLDNDGLKDLYVLSGYYTAPERIGLPFDC